MTAPIRTKAATLAWMRARLGISRHDSECDWSGGYNVDDCALFQSVAIWGTRTVWNVDVFKTVAGGTYHKGLRGLTGGDVILFDWNHDGGGNHVEMALAKPKAGRVATIGANGSDTIAVAYRTRPTSYVLGYFRPHYKPEPKPPKKKPAAPAEMELFDMVGFIRDTKGRIYVVDPLTGKKRHIKTNSEWLGYKRNGAKYHQVAKQKRADAIPNM